MAASYQTTSYVTQDPISPYQDFLSKLYICEKMDPREFEEYLWELFQSLGVKTERPPKSADQGADLLFYNSRSERIAVQAKRYAGSVGNTAVQQILGAKHFYDCEGGIVIATAPFTPAAIALAARAPRVHLWGVSELEQCINCPGVLDEV